MENANENKAKFFAQYWGQETDFESHELDGDNVKVGNYFYSELSQFHRNNSKLLLKPLSAISDEDAIEVKKLSDIDFTHIMGSKESEFRAFMSTRFTNVADFLRSRGYLLPYMGLSTETLIAYGWCVTE